MRACVRACVRACGRACVRPCGRACVRACVRAFVRACVRACVRAALAKRSLLPDNGNGVRHAGNIFLDGQPLSSLKLKDVHRHIAIVSQVRMAFAVARAASDGHREASDGPS